MPSWDDLEKKARTGPTPDEYAEHCARVFSSPDGKALLKKMRERAERAMPLNCSESALREREGQRHFISEIEVLTARGLELMKSNKA